MSAPPLRVHAAPAERPLFGVRPPDPCSFVLLGVTGDLAARKLLPALAELAADGALPGDLALVGVSRSAASDAALRERLDAALEPHLDARAAGGWRELRPRVSAVAGALEEGATYERLAARLEEVEGRQDTGGNRLAYLATPASAFPAALEHLPRSGVVERRAPGGPGPWSRVVVEKPFGRDLASAESLNALALESLDEAQVYRIDHYLGKETVQNILVARFGNTIFEPLWNRHHVDHVQITMAEDIGVGSRGAFYEETGVLRDIVQNHLLQVLALVAMEAPISYEADEIRGMKAQALRALRAPRPEEIASSVVHGQYAGYRDERGVDPGSRTPTYVALRAFVDNWRWQGVPFFLRAGKGLARRKTAVSLHFERIPFCLFGDEEACQLLEPNVLTLHIQPDEGISWRIASKVPGEVLRTAGVTMDFRYAEAFDEPSPSAYERLLLDAMRGDPTLFARRDEVELSWRFCEPILNAWEEARDAPFVYDRGSTGPAEARALLADAAARWDPLEP